MSNRFQANDHPSDSISEKEPTRDDLKNAMDDQSDAPPFLSASNAKVILVQAIGASLNGYSIGFVGVYATLFGYSTNCASFSSEKGCSTVPNADCKWFTDASSTGYCGWTDITCRRAYTYTGPADMPAAIAQCDCPMR
ncbi:hypothetical protein Q4I30_000136, partial [Leishmania utingensis]